MIRLTTADRTLYTDALRYIRLHKNGCYVACNEDQAEGICAKVHENLEEVGMVLNDTVLVFIEGAMHGTEPVCLKIEKDIEITTGMMQEAEDAQNALAIILGEEV